MDQHTTRTSRATIIIVILIVAAAAGAWIAYRAGIAEGHKAFSHISGFAWSADEWARRTHGLRTSFNPDHDLSTTELTITPGDARWLDFMFWALNNKVAEHQVEAYGGTEWNGPTGGVIFHWAPGSRWETHTLASFGFTIGHIVGEHQWSDVQFPEFFDQYGGAYGMNVKDRIAETGDTTAAPWVKFLEYCGGPESPYYRYLFHQESVIDPIRDRVYLIGGQGVGFEYTFERYYHELREVLTDARAYQFFQLYDKYGPGFAVYGGWAQNKLTAALRGIYFTDDTSRWSTKPGVAKAVRYNPVVPSPDIPADLPDRDAAVQGQKIYNKQCAPCHGVPGDGKGFLAAGFQVKPRDFRQGTYKFRSTMNGELPTLADVEKTIRIGVPTTTMPAWRHFLTPEEIHNLACYVVSFSPRFVDARKSNAKPEQLTIPPVPADLASLAERGKEFYRVNQCGKCHGDEGRGDGPSAPTLKDSWDQPIVPADLTYKWAFKNGYAPEDVYRTMSAGLNGTPMPSYYDSFTNDTDRWALVSYVLSLSPATRPVLHMADFKSGVLAVSQRLDANGRVRK